MVFSAIVAGLSFAAVFLLPDLIQPAARPVLLIGLPLLPLIGLSQVRAAALRGLGRIVFSQLPDAILRPGLLIVLVTVVFLMTDQELSASWVMGMHLLAATVALLVGAALLWRSRPQGLITENVKVVQGRSWRAAIWPLALIGGAQSITANADFLMLGWWRDAAEIGHYKVAASAANVSLIGLSIVAMVSEPRFAALFRLGKTTELARLAAVSSLIGFLLAIPPILVLAIFGKPLLHAIFGPGFENGGPALAILVAGQLVNTFFGSCISLLNMSGHERLAMRGIGFATLLNVALNFLLIPLFGIEGAALATLVSTLTWNVLLWRSCLKLLSIDSSVIGFWRKGVR